MSLPPDPVPDLGGRLASLASRVGALARERAARSPAGRVRLARPLQGPPAAAQAEALLAGESAFIAGPAPEAPYAPGLEAFQRQISGCLRCALGSKRRAFVFGEGKADAPLAFVGAAPGYDEEAHGSPLAGAAGDLFDRILAAMGYKRSGVYVCNLLKCRSHAPGEPEAQALAACRPYLEHQLALLRPKAVVALGEASARFLLASASPLADLRGRWGNFKNLKVMPTYHPRDLLRDEGLKRHVWADLKQVLQVVQAAQAQVKGGI